MQISQIHFSAIYPFKGLNADIAKHKERLVREEIPYRVYEETYGSTTGPLPFDGREGFFVTESDIAVFDSLHAENTRYLAQKEPRKTDFGIHKRAVRTDFKRLCDNSPYIQLCREIAGLVNQLNQPKVNLGSVFAGLQNLKTRTDDFQTLKKGEFFTGLETLAERYKKDSPSKLSPQFLDYVRRNMHEPWNSSQINNPKFNPRTGSFDP